MFLFFKPSRPRLGPTQPAAEWVPGRDADPLDPPSTHIKNEWSYTHTHTHTNTYTHTSPATRRHGVNSDYFRLVLRHVSPVSP
jgi:hypothetical protein